MKRIIPFLLSVSLLYSCHQEEEISLPTDGPVINLAELGLSENDVVQGRMRIKLKEEPAGNLSEKSIEGGISARIKMIGRSASALKITRMERTFPHAGKYEERTRRDCICGMMFGIRRMFLWRVRPVKFQCWKG